MSAPSIPISDVEQFGEVNAQKITVDDLRPVNMTVTGTTTVPELTTPSVKSTGVLNLRSDTDEIRFHADLLQGGGAQSIGRSGDRVSAVWASSVDATTVTTPTANATTVNSTTVNAPTVNATTVHSPGTLELISDANFIECQSDLVSTGTETIGAGGRPWTSALITTINSTTVNSTNVNATSVNAEQAMLSGPANTGLVTTPAGKQLVVTSNNATAAGMGASGSMQIIGNAVYLYDGVTADPSLKIELDRVVTDRQASFKENVEIGIGGLVTTAAMYAGLAKKLVVSANGNTAAGVAAAGNIHIDGNVVDMYDGLSATPALAFRNNTVISPKFSYGYVSNGAVGVGGTTVANSLFSFDLATAGTGGFGIRGSDTIQYVGALAAITGFRALVAGVYKVAVSGRFSGGGVSEDILAITINGNSSAYGTAGYAEAIFLLSANDTVGARGIGALGVWQRNGLSLSIERMPGQYNIEFAQYNAQTQFNNQ